jgi:hypothetical protein
MALRGYIRERPKGPSVEDQRKALAKAGVPVEGTHPPIYIDLIGKRTRKNLDNPLPQRAAAIDSLRPGNKLVIFDPATLGTAEGDILDALAATGLKEATVVTCDPPGEFRWHPDVPEALGFAVDGAKKLDRERRRVRTEAGPIIGRPKKLTGEALDFARSLWGRKDLSYPKVVAEIKAKTGVEVSVKTLLSALGHKTDAVEKAERSLRRRAVPPPEKQPQRRKAKRKATKS